MKKEFEFIAHGAFHIWNGGFSLCGDVKVGAIEKGDTVEVFRDRDKITAKVGLIVTKDGKIIDRTNGYTDVSLNLIEFSDERLNTIEQRFDPDIDEQPPLHELFGTSIPIRLTHSEK